MERLFIHPFLVFAALATSLAVSQTLPGCQHKCGKVHIPYPFGTTKECSLDRFFLVSCNTTTQTLYLTLAFDIQVLNISLEGKIHFAASLSYDCYGLEPYSSGLGFGSTYVLSSPSNKLVALGCNTVGLSVALNSFDYAHVTSCVSLCFQEAFLSNGSCSGLGCCQTSIVGSSSENWVTLRSSLNFTDTVRYNPCNYAFVVENNAYNFKAKHLNYSLRDFRSIIKKLPTVYEWTVGNTTCREAKRIQSSYYCKAAHSVCEDTDKRRGYLCRCADGFEGNPYIKNGCQDVNECADPRHNGCVIPVTCQNTVGNYTCHCGNDYIGDGKKDGEGCIPHHKRSWKLVIVVGCVTIAAFGVLVGCLLYTFVMRKKKTMRRRENNFKLNGGLILRQLLSNLEPSEGRTKIFTEDELETATNKFNESQIIGEGGYGTVYRGTINSEVVAIKRSKVMDRGQIEQFVNEVTILSRIEHPNVVKLLGCCLETSVPLLVYEFIGNQTLHHHLHSEDSIGWEVRLNIAVQTADALGYMHFDAPSQIIHRDVKSVNILLDDDFQAKVADFGASRMLAMDQTQLATIVQGTLGYMDPEYYTSGVLSHKSDVYSFGVVMAELLTGKHVINQNRPADVRYLAALFNVALKDDKLDAIIDKKVANEAPPRQLKVFADLISQCIKMKGEDRPTMKQVKAALEELRNFHSSDDGAPCPADLPREQDSSGHEAGFGIKRSASY